MVYCQAKHLKLLGVSSSIHSCHKVAKRIRDKFGTKKMHYKQVAQYFNLDEELVLGVILGNSTVKIYKGKNDLLVVV